MAGKSSCLVSTCKPEVTPADQGALQRPSHRRPFCCSLAQPCRMQLPPQH
jgi:hypothetical protein